MVGFLFGVGTSMGRGIIFFGFWYFRGYRVFCVVLRFFLDKFFFVRSLAWLFFGVYMTV